MFYGKGAGKYPTASAVVADVADCARNIDRPLGCAWTQEAASLTEPGHVERKFFLRLKNSAQKAASEGIVCTIPSSLNLQSLSILGISA